MVVALTAIKDQPSQHSCLLPVLCDEKNGKERLPAPGLCTYEVMASDTVAHKGSI